MVIFLFDFQVVLIADCLLKDLELDKVFDAVVLPGKQKVFWQIVII